MKADSTTRDFKLHFGVGISARSGCACSFAIGTNFIFRGTFSSGKERQQEVGAQ
jgi:hypothetical protein